MLRSLCALALLVLLAFAPADEGSDPAAAPAQVKGTLVIVGGGGTPESVLAHMLAIAGGVEKARVLIFPQASQREESGAENVAMFLEAGARTAEVAEVEDVEALLAKIAAADVIWFSGGDQSRLMAALLGDPRLVPAIAARHAAGAVVGGTSAGAAVMSDPMLIGGAVEDGIVAGGTPTGRGLGLLPDALVDQHFLARRRVFRLTSALLDGPHRLGFGIDERTALVIAGGRAEVIGERGVLVLDARDAAIRDAEAGSPRGFTGLVTHHLVPGMTFALEAKPRPREEDDRRDR